MPSEDAKCRERVNLSPSSSVFLRNRSSMMTMPFVISMSQMRGIDMLVLFPILTKGSFPIISHFHIDIFLIAIATPIYKVLTSQTLLSLIVSLYPINYIYIYISIIYIKKKIVSSRNKELTMVPLFCD